MRKKEIVGYNKGLNRLINNLENTLKVKYCYFDKNFSKHKFKLLNEESSTIYLSNLAIKYFCEIKQ